MKTIVINIIAALLVVAAAASPLWATSLRGTTGPKGPSIVALGDTYSFGKVRQGTSVEHVFRVRNQGTAQLVIEKAQGT